MNRPNEGQAIGVKDASAPLWLRCAPAVFLLFWSAGFSFAKLGVAQTGPVTFLALRYVFVLAVLVPVFLLLRPSLPRTRAQWGHLAAVGALIQGMYFIFTYLAFKFDAPAGEVALIVSLQPILVALLAHPFADEKVSPRRWVGLILGFAGALIVIAARSHWHGSSFWGVVSAIIALFAITTGTLYEKRFGVSHHPVSSNLILYGVGLILTLPLALGMEGFQVRWTIGLAVSLAYLVLCNSLIAITLLLAMIRAGEASRVSALFFLVPPVAAFIAWLLLGEILPPAAWAGMVLAAAGVAIASRAPAKDRRA